MSYSLQIECNQNSLDELNRNLDLLKNDDVDYIISLIESGKIYIVFAQCNIVY